MEKSLYRIINSILLAVFALFSLGEGMGIWQVMWYHCGLALFIMAGLAAFCCLKLRGRLLAGVSVAACVGVSFFVIGAGRMAFFWQSYLAGISGSGEAALEWGIAQECVQVLLLSVGSFLFQLLAERAFALKAAAAALLLVYLLGDLLTGKGMLHVGVVCVLTYVAMVFVEWTQKHWQKQKRNKDRLYMVWIMPFLGLYFLLMLAMPAPKEPYDWQFAKDACSWVRDRCIVLGQHLQGQGREDFENVVSGFSEDGRLPGGFTDARQEVMTISGQKNLKTNVYLVGKVYDTFTGRQWLQSSESAMEDRLLDALETAYAVGVYDKEGEDNYMHSTKLQVTYRYFHTGYLFAPLKTWQIWNARPYETAGGSLLFQEKAGYGTTYEVRFFQMNVDHAKFYKFLDAERKQEEAVWRRLQKEYIKNSEEQYTLEDLENHRQEIYQVYGQETVLSQGTLDWLDKVTEGADTDVEKLKAIEAALAGFEYTRTPGGLPEEITSEEAFLDFFLLESRKGFCSYFASAFVLLARAEGIPARYVEGFCVPVEGEPETIVYSDMAHAWPEVYIEGVGWIPFEPTPGYGSIRYTPWEMVDSKTNRPEGSIPGWGDVMGADGIDREAEDADGNADADGHADDDAISMDMSEAERAQRRANVIRIVLFTLLFAVLAGAMLLGVDGCLARRRYRRWTLKQKVMAELKRNLQLLAMLGYQRAEHETLEEVEKRAWAIMNVEDAGQETKLQFLKLYEDVFYGNHAVTEEMLQQILKERKILMEMLKKWKYLRYLYYRILLRNMM